MDVEKRESSYVIHENVFWCNHYGKQHGGSSKKLKIGITYDPAIALLCTYPNFFDSKRYMHPHVYCGIIYDKSRHESNPSVHG